jgi:hypothetical protein
MFSVENGEIQKQGVPAGWRREHGGYDLVGAVPLKNQKTITQQNVRINYENALQLERKN